MFQTFDWLAKWQRHIGSRNRALPAIIFGRDRHGQLLFIVPLAVVPQGPFRRLTWLASELCDCNAPLLGERFSELVSAQRFARLWREAVNLMRRDRRLRFDWIDLQKMPEMIGTQRNPFVAIEPAVRRRRAYRQERSDAGPIQFDHVAAASLRGRLVVPVVSAWRRVRRLIKQIQISRYAPSNTRAPAA